MNSDMGDTDGSPSVIVVGSRSSDVDQIDIALDGVGLSIDVVVCRDRDSALTELDRHRTPLVIVGRRLDDCSGIDFLTDIAEIATDGHLVAFDPDRSSPFTEAAVEAGVDDIIVAGDQSLIRIRLERLIDGVTRRQHLRSINRRLDSIFENFPVVVYRCRNESGWPIEFVEGDCPSVLGVSTSALMSGEVSLGHDLIHPDDRDEVWDEVQKAFDNQSLFELSYRIKTPDGEVRWVWERGRGIFDGDEIVALEGAITDITERKRQQQRFEQEHQRFSTLLNNTTDAVVYLELTDNTAIVREVNDAFVELFGFSKDEILGESMVDQVIPSDSMEQFRGYVDRVRAGEKIRTEVTRMTATGERQFLLRAVPVDHDETSNHAYAMYTDITPIKIREQQVQVLNRVLRHNLRNVMTVIQGHVTMIEERADSSRIGEITDEIKDGAEDLVSLSNRARELSTIIEADLGSETAELAQVIEAACRDVEAEYPNGHIERPDLPEVSVPASDHLTDAVAELCRNVFEHTNEHTVTIDVIHSDYDDTILISVLDNGPGIPAHEQQVLEDGEESALLHGSGLGFWMVQWIVEAIGGEMAINSSDGSGTAVELTVPTADQAPT